MVTTAVLIGTCCESISHKMTPEYKKSHFTSCHSKSKAVTVGQNCSERKKTKSAKMRIFLTPVFSSSSAGMLRIQFRVENDEQMSSELRNRLNEKRKTQNENAGGNFLFHFCYEVALLWFIDSF